MLAVITLRNTLDKEAFALVQQPFCLTVDLGVLDGASLTDEAGHS